MLYIRTVILWIPALAKMTPFLTEKPILDTNFKPKKPKIHLD